MNEFVSALVPAIGQALVDFVWQGCVIGLLAAVALRLARDARPQVRYAIACLAMLACAIVPLVGVAMQFDGAQATAFVASSESMRIVGTTSATAAPLDWHARLDALLPLIVALWASGASVFCLRTLFGVAWVHRMRSTKQPPLHAHWQAKLDVLAARFGLQGVALRLVDALDSPVAAGWWRPVVLLPISVALRLPPHLVEALLAHELAHVRRHDYLVNLLQRAVEALLFYHPVTWWLTRRVRIERELVADRLAADVIGEPRRLALALAALSELPASLPAPPHLAHAAHGGHLMSRIQQLLQNKSRTTSGGRQPAGRVALPLIGVAAACIAFYAQAQIGKDAQRAEQIAAETAAAVAATAPDIARESAEAVAAAAPAIAAESAKAAAEAAPAIAEASAAAVAANAAEIAAESAKAAAAAAPEIAAQAAQATAAIAAEQAAEAAQMAQASRSAHVTRIANDNDRDAWAVVRKNEDGYSMSGSTRDMKEIEAAKRALQDDFVWFRRDGKAYVIDDPSIVSRARAAWKDSDVLGQRMSVLGAQMEVHGKKMEAYGAKMEKLAQGHQPSPAMQQAQERMGTLGEQQQELAGKQQLLAMKMRKADNDAEEEKLDRDMNALSEQMNALGDQMEAQGRIIERESAKLEQNQAPMESLGREMEAASKPMDALGKQMGELGKQQEVLVRKAEKELNALIAEAQQKGLVKPAPAGRKQ
jgi:beta-lactamase regulating signal transducer with metallopeptidase domain